MLVCNLRDILTQRKMSRRELSRRSRVSINTVCRWVNDPPEMLDVRVLSAFCAVLGVPVGALVQWVPDAERRASHRP